MYSLVVACPFEFLSQSLYIWNHYGNVVVAVCSIVVVAVVGLIFCGTLFSASIVLVFKESLAVLHFQTWALNKLQQNFELPHISDQILQDTLALQLNKPNPFLHPLTWIETSHTLTYLGWHRHLRGKYSMWGCHNYTLSYLTPPHTPLIPKTPPLPYSFVPVVPFLVSTHVYLYSLTFYLDLMKQPHYRGCICLFLNIIHNCFISAKGVNI